MKSNQLTIKDFMTSAHSKNKDEVAVLTNKLFNVNVRLFRKSAKYRDIILDICTYMKNVMSIKFDDYPHVSGISGANVGIPFNIIAYREGGKRSGKPIIMINPVITFYSEDGKKTKSNCGSILLKEKIDVFRHQTITVRFYDECCKMHRGNFDLSDGGGTIQHEVDHNMGILITSK